MAASIPSRDQRTPFRVPTVFTAGFRFFFLSAGVFSVLAMFAWIAWLGLRAAGLDPAVMPMAMTPQLWHAHEMVYGYTLAVMAGFFVTAVPSWTGTKETGAAFVTLSGTVWLAGRLAVWFSASLDPLLVAAIDLAFVPVLSSAILGRLARKSQVRNMVFLALLTLLFTGNLMMHLTWIGWTDGGAEAGIRLGIFTSAAMIAIIGGRVVPAFTRNALIRQGIEDNLPRSRALLDRPGILLALLAAIGCLPFVPSSVLGSICIAAGILTLLRLAGWRGIATRKEPILWILHAAFGLLGLGYLVYGLSLLGDFWQETAALHLLAAGAIGSMTLAMMTRASLGHAGRPLKVSRPVVAAYAALIAAALVRVFAIPFFGYFATMLLSGGLWILAFSLYVAVYFPILTQPRQRK